MADVRSYVPPFALGETLSGLVSARVLVSRASDAKVGDIVLSYVGWTQFAILSKGQYSPPAALHTQDPIEIVHLVGLTSLTSWVGVKKLAKVKEGDVVVISGAAGATGSLAGQIAKIMGAKKVVGIAGGPEKCKWVEEIGFDVCLDYKAKDFKKRFNEETEEFIDVYYDNGEFKHDSWGATGVFLFFFVWETPWADTDGFLVGGEILDMALGRAQAHARFIMCGQISQYELPYSARYGLKVCC